VQVRIKCTAPEAAPIRQIFDSTGFGSLAAVFGLDIRGFEG